MTRDAVTWFEIPARDLDRARRLHEPRPGRTLRRGTAGGPRVGLHPLA